MEVKNRFVRSAVLENMAKKNGVVSDELIKTFATLAKGEVGLIITGFMHVHPLGRTYPHQTGIHNDNLILPYAMSDSYSGIAKIDINDILDEISPIKI